MRKIIALFLTVSLVFICLTACESFRAFVEKLPFVPSSEKSESELLTEYKNQVSKDEFQMQYKLAYENEQPDYTKDFVYEYYNDSKETELDGKVNISTSNSVSQYDADSEIFLYTYEFQNNDEPAYVENYYFKYKMSGDKLMFFSSRTNETEERQLGFDEFWEFAHSQIPFVLFPNPYKLYDDTIYYIDTNANGEKVFTLYTEQADGYSVRQIMITKEKMIIFTKKLNREEEYETNVINKYCIYNREVELAWDIET